MRYLKTYRLFESKDEERRFREINLIEDHKEYVRELFYDLMDLGYVAHPSYMGGIIFVVRITKTSNLIPHTSGLDKPFVFSDLISDVDRFMRYLKYMKADSIQCGVIFANYDDDQKFIRQYGRRHSWEDLKQKIKEYTNDSEAYPYDDVSVRDTPAAIVGLQINYSININ